jgi:DNA-binding NtrC family response regulator
MLLSQKVKLEVLSGPEQGRTVLVDGDHIRIGATDDNDLPIRDTTVSRAHCEIVRTEGAYMLRDRGSTNGTFLHDRRVVEVELAPGAIFRVGHTEISFEPKKRWERIKSSSADEFGGMVGTAPISRALFGLLARVARTRLSTVILGETGTGKELSARALHEESERHAGPFVVVDCGAVTGNLVESELFGHEKGAFTGADRARAGAFELGDGGTVFLDEIGELPLELQPKLLRALERREVKRLGATEPVAVDVRIVCATHRPLVDMVAAGGFREDLYYRLAEVVVTLPPLRERREDIPLIAERIVEQEGKLGSVVRKLDPATVEALVRRPWPGNVREVRNVLRRAISLATDAVLMPSDLDVAAPPLARSAPAPIAEAPRAELADEVALLPIVEARTKWNEVMERQYLEKLLDRCDGDLDRAAEIAGVHKKSLQRLMRMHNM